MMVWTDVSRGIVEVPFDFEKVNTDCEVFKKNACPFVGKPSTICGCGFDGMAKKGCIKVHEKTKKVEE
jgi:hypothetical protein